MHMQELQEEIKWPSSTQVFPSFLQARESRSDVGSIGPAFLRHFQSPTIFLKISFDGDFLLPILVGTYMLMRFQPYLWILVYLSWITFITLNECK